MPCRNSRRCSIPRTGDSGADVGGCPACDAHEFVKGRREDVVRVAPGGPYLIEVAQVDVDDRAQGSGVTDGGDAAGRLCTP